MGYPEYSYPYTPPPWANQYPYYYTTGLPARAEAVHGMSEPLYLMDPYVVQTLQSVVGSMVVVNTGDGTVRGRLTKVQPDHIVVKQPEGQSTFYVRIQKIVWVMPD